MESLTNLTELKAAGLTPEEIRLRCLELALQDGRIFPDRVIPSAVCFAEFVLGGYHSQPGGSESKE